MLAVSTWTCTMRITHVFQPPLPPLFFTAHANISCNFSFPFFCCMLKKNFPYTHDSIPSITTVPSQFLRQLTYTHHHIPHFQTFKKLNIIVVFSACSYWQRSFFYNHRSRKMSIDELKSFRICVVGSGGVGKSCVTLRLLKNKFAEVSSRFGCSERLVCFFDRTNLAFECISAFSIIVFFSSLFPLLNAH